LLRTEVARVSTIIVLFNLRPGVSAEAYERWARATDLPVVNDLPSVSSFEVLKASGLLGGGATPYQYIEILRVRDPAGLARDVATETMKRVAAEFQAFADQPLFINTDTL
jgi:REDY-like protein HapK